MTILDRMFARVVLSLHSLRDERGQTATEYAVIVGAIVVAGAIGIGIFFDAISDYLTGLIDSLPG
jgi:Flp pilus assembly pilin Flp